MRNYINLKNFALFDSDWDYWELDYNFFAPNWDYLVIFLPIFFGTETVLKIGEYHSDMFTIMENYLTLTSRQCWNVTTFTYFCAENICTYTRYLQNISASKNFQNWKDIHLSSNPLVYSSKYWTVNWGLYSYANWQAIERINVKTL